MASFTEDNKLIISQVKKLKKLFEKSKVQLSIINYPFNTLSMGIITITGLPLKKAAPWLELAVCCLVKDLK